MKKFKTKRRRHYLLYLVLFYLLFQALKNIGFMNLANLILKDEKYNLLNGIVSYAGNQKIVLSKNDVPVFHYTLKDDPIIYLYNTHQKEEYIDTNIIELSNYFMDSLNSNGLFTLYEERSVPQYLSENPNFKKTYDVTNFFLKQILSEYNNFRLIIDMHRDSVSKKISTVEIDNKSYAKVLFVMNPNYKENMDLVIRLNNKINEYYKGLSRGIYDDYPDTFNQNLNGTIILLEVGGKYNTNEEVKNTIDAMVRVIKEII